jgi:hypothetical protein
MVYLSPILIVLAVYLAHLVRKHRLRTRVAEWSKNREILTDEAFYTALNVPSIPKDAAVSVRATVSDAVRIPKELIRPSDRVCELERIGSPSHPSTVDFFEDMWSVVGPKDDFRSLTVRDFVIEFGPKMK